MGKGNLCCTKVNKQDVNPAGNVQRRRFNSVSMKQKPAEEETDFEDLTFEKKQNPLVQSIESEKEIQIDLNTLEVEEQAEKENLKMPLVTVEDEDLATASNSKAEDAESAELEQVESVEVEKVESVESVDPEEEFASHMDLLCQNMEGTHGQYKVNNLNFLKELLQLNDNQIAKMLNGQTAKKTLGHTKVFVRIVNSMVVIKIVEGFMSLNELFHHCCESKKCAERRMVEQKVQKLITLNDEIPRRNSNPQKKNRTRVTVSMPPMLRKTMKDETPLMRATTNISENNSVEKESKQVEKLKAQQDLEKQRTLKAEEKSDALKGFNKYEPCEEGTICDEKFKYLMVNLCEGKKMTDTKLKESLGHHYHEKEEGVLYFQWKQFVDMIIKFNAVGEEGIKAILGYDVGEKFVYAKMLNMILRSDNDCQKYLPLNLDDESLFNIMESGILPCKLMMAMNKDCIDSRAINRGKNLIETEKRQNLKMAIGAAKSEGLPLEGVTYKAFLEKDGALVMTFLREVLTLYMTKGINLKETPEIYNLADGDEEVGDLLKLSPEAILIRWVNYHLKKAGQERRISNLGQDISDSWALFHVLHRLDEENCSLVGIDDEDLTARASKMITNSAVIGVPEVVAPSDITQANTKVNTLFVAELFNAKHGLEPLDDGFDMAALLDDDIEGSQEERMYRLWINSLGIDGLNVNNLYEECKDGVLLCKVIDRLHPGAIDWNKVTLEPRHLFDRNTNNATAIQACKDSLGFKMVAICGPDITKGDRKLVLSTVYQLCRYSYMQMIGNQSDKEIVAWANALVGGKVPAIADFQDKSLGNGLYLIHLCAGIEARAINWDIVTPGESEEDKMMNAKYIISIARKLGAVIFCVWENITEVNPKQMLILFAALMQAQKELKAEQ